MIRTVFPLLLMAACVGLIASACDAQSPARSAAQRSAATSPAQPPAAELASIEKALAERFRGAPIKGLRASVLPGLYEAMVGDDLIYFDAKVSHFIVGTLVEAATMKNLTEERAAELRAIDVKQLPVKDAIKFVRGKGERVLYVFTDVDCPFCTRLEQTLQEMDNITVYNFMFPIDSLHPAARSKQKAIWCAKDPLAAWQDAVLRRKFDPNAKGDCDNPVDRTVELGQRLGIRGTPTFFLADGRMVSGALPRERLEALLNAAQARVAAQPK
ncbi:MAG: DsbC family protein [Casimicrobiaceae bacterium]|nr:DsbC family protein [Casimicrobiaceae bacterium]MCX8098673.1 DsbC family protein [Casimicrobiaceae bacterium]MDW8311866.1 DsbC family protein [Burkholderiales bacterium]